MIEYHDTYWMPYYRPGVRKLTTSDILYLNKPIELIKLFPEDIVLIRLDDETFRIEPAMLAFYKLIWDQASVEDKKLLRRHFNRSEHIKGQLKKKLVTESIRNWYMSVILGASDED